ncbi:MAG: Gfo/Idh/MocA family protein [Dehalococcoidia bacterium]
MARDRTIHQAAIIGFGGMGQRHYAAYQRIGAEVIAICDADSGKRDLLTSTYPVVRAYAHAHELLAEEEVDIVSVATNGPGHAEVVIEAARQGIKNIFCEKPLATNLEDARRMIEVCAQQGSRLAVNHKHRWSPNHRKLKHLVDEGIIGPLRHLYVQCGSVGLGNMGVHFFDMMRFYTDSEVDWVIGVVDHTGTPNVRGPQFADPAGYGIISFKNGVRAFIDTSEDTGVQYVFELVGTYGRVVIDELNDCWSIKARSPKERGAPLTRYVTPMQEIPFALETPYDIVAMTASGLAELLSGGGISCAGEDGYRVLEVVMAFHLSDERGQERVLLPLEGEALKKDVPIA